MRWMKKQTCEHAAFLFVSCYQFPQESCQQSHQTFSGEVFRSTSSTISKFSWCPWRSLSTSQTRKRAKFPVILMVISLKRAASSHDTVSRMTVQSVGQGSTTNAKNISFLYSSPGKCCFQHFLWFIWGFHLEKGWKWSLKVKRSRIIATCPSSSEVITYVFKFYLSAEVIVNEKKQLTENWRIISFHIIQLI